MISLFIGLIRTITYYLFESKNKDIPLGVVAALCAATITNYFALNQIAPQPLRMLDILPVLSFVLYAIIFSIRNLQVVRYTIPTSNKNTRIYYLRSKCGFSNYKYLSVRWIW